MSKRMTPHQGGAPTARMDAVVAPTRDLFEIGDVLNDTYEIRGVLGQGGMGQVYDAYDRFLHRHVAIKVAWPTIGAWAVRKEAQALAAIRHPGLVCVHHCGIHNGTEYVVMERVSGVNLETQIRRRTHGGRPFAVVEAIEILVALAEGLAAVHRAGIAHRDVKPDNVMVAPGGRVVMMDFGVFLPEFAAGGQETATGSPAYMAPETITGTVGYGGGFLVDVYAFGVVTYEMLTGELPFNGETARDFYLQHLSTPAPPLRAKRPDAPPQLEALVTALLTKDPHDRPQSMDEVAGRLRTMIAAAKTEARGPLSTGRSFVAEEGPPSGTLSRPRSG
jgi:serine/threonine protein kinase